jgi:hypothetical protein
MAKAHRNDGENDGTNIPDRIVPARIQDYLIKKTGMKTEMKGRTGRMAYRETDR